MAEDHPTDEFPYASYRDNVAALATNAETHQNLNQFFQLPSLTMTNFNLDYPRRTPNEGSVLIVNFIEGDLEIRSYQVREGHFVAETYFCIGHFNERPQSPQCKSIANDPLAKSMSTIEISTTSVRTN